VGVSRSVANASRSGVLEAKVTGGKSSLSPSNGRFESVKRLYLKLLLRSDPAKQWVKPQALGPLMRDIEVGPVPTQPWVIPTGSQPAAL